MKENILVIAVVGILVVLVLSATGVIGNNTLLKGSSNGDVVIEDMKKIATTTGSYDITVPTKLIDVDYGRRYMVVSNTDATNNVYIYATTTPLGYNFLGEFKDPMDDSTSTLSHTGQIATSTIVSPLAGILIAPKTSYEFDADNLVVGELWASSTNATNIQVNVNYK